MRVVLGVLVAGMLAGTAAADGPREIVVTGEGMVEAAPDMAIVSGGVETQAEAAETALAENAEAMRAVIAAVTGAGIAPADLQTSQIALFPIYPERDGGDWEPEVVGYGARNLVTVRVRDLEVLGGVLDAMAEAGANRLSGIRFAIAEPRPLADQARERAVADARAKAELYARAAGVTLGDVVGIRETQPFDQPFPMRAQAEMAMDGAVMEGTLEVEAMVEMVFTIED